MAAGLALRDVAGSFALAEVAHDRQDVSHRRAVHPEVTLYGRVQEVAAQDIGFRQGAFPADGAGGRGNEASVPRLRCL